MSEAPKKIWVDELEWGFGIKPEWDNAQYYIRADLVDELIEALEELIKYVGRDHAGVGLADLHNTGKIS